MLTSRGYLLQQAVMVLFVPDHQPQYSCAHWVHADKQNPVTAACCDGNLQARSCMILSCLLSMSILNPGAGCNLQQRQSGTHAWLSSSTVSPAHITAASCCIVQRHQLAKTLRSIGKLMCQAQCLRAV